ncbi:cytochrome c biogenesis protein CcsA [Nonomuraea sp. NPDC005692]|uniref:cytochrome c biogenesis protein CcsA n=1 Tax=Nonomuraea sp. NPDC005692 TaxID=3157168 RepID=UPI0033F0F1F5
MQILWRTAIWMSGAAGRRALAVVANAGVIAAMLVALFLVPADGEQGIVQRLMYLHVPTAWAGYMNFTVVFVASIAYLRTQRVHWDRLAAAAAEAGVVFTGLTITLGALWGRPVWGTWWSWDPRLTTTLILFLVYSAYLTVRRLPDNPARSYRWAAVVGIVGFADVPLVHLSVLWWRSLHQEPSLLRPEAPALAPSMLATLVAATMAFTVMSVWLIIMRLRLRRMEDRTFIDASGRLIERVRPVVIPAMPERKD